jgi:hypothetical protein
MNKDIVNIETISAESIEPHAPPLATVLDINSCNNRNIYYDPIENTNNNSSNRLTINPIKCLKLTSNALLSGIFITIFIFESDDISRKELLYYILLSIIAIGK